MTKEEKEIEKLKLKKEAYLRATYLVLCMNEYKSTPDEIHRLAMEFYIDPDIKFLLPSGRSGNAIALALELNNYAAAEYLINNANRIEIETEYIASEVGKSNTFTLKDEYLYSLKTNEDVLPQLYEDTDEDYEAYIDSYLRNMESCLRIEKSLKLSEEEKKEYSLKLKNNY